MKICIISFTQNGKKLQEKILPYLHGDICIYDGNNVKKYVAVNFKNCSVMIFIGAVAIAVRLIAPYIKSKDTDPAIIVLDELGRYAIPILSGHLGGANEFCVELCAKTGAIPVITTATDINNKFKVDVWSKNNNCVIGDISKIKNVSMAILNGDPVGFYSDFGVCVALPDEIAFNTDIVGICISIDEDKRPFKNTLNIIPKIVSIGVGCKKNTQIDEFEKIIVDTLKGCGVSLKAVRNIASVSLKKDEKCIIAFAQKYKIPFLTYEADKLNSVQGDFESSEFVRNVTGTDNVCQRSAVIASDGGTVIVKKKCFKGVTVSIAIKDWKCVF